MANSKKVLVGLAEVLEGVRQHAVIREAAPEDRPLVLGEGISSQISGRTYWSLSMNDILGRLNVEHAPDKEPEPPTAEDALKRFK